MEGEQEQKKFSFLKRDQFEELEVEDKQSYLKQGLNEGIETMNEKQLRQFNEYYKDYHLPRYRLWMLLPFNIVACGCAMYYTMNIKEFSRKYFKLKKYGFRELLYYGTVQSMAFVMSYSIGTMLVTGLWDPLQYGRDVAKIKGKIVDVTIRHDSNAQKYFLYNFMEYFNLSQEVVDKAKQDLENQKKLLQEQKYFDEETEKLLKNEDEDDEEIQDDQNGDDEDDGNQEEKDKIENSFMFSVIKHLMPKDNSNNSDNDKKSN